MTIIFNFDLIKKLKNFSISGSLLLLVAINCLSTANAYQLSGSKWPQPSTTFYVSIPGENGLWDNAFEAAMYEWNADTVFQFQIVRGTFSDPCDSNDDRNGVRFSSTDCGDAWGSTTLAITNRWYIASTILETDIVFNSNESWDVYSTSWQNSVSDFKRVAVHELGHALGLTHEDRYASTIMGTYAGDITTPQQDDINGVAAMYGYGSGCTYSISPSSKSFSANGGSSSVFVTASGLTCGWSTSESLSWVSLSPASGSWIGTVTVTVSVNTGAARNGSITIAGQPYTISQAAAIIDDYAGNTSTNGRVAVNGSVVGNIEIATDQDWFRIVLTAGTTYTIDLEGSPTSAGTLSDTYLTGIYNSAGSLITGTSNDDNGTNHNSRVFFSPPTSGDYFIAASAYLSRVGTYKLSVIEVPPNAIYRFFNTTTGTHFFTSSLNERNSIAETLPQFNYEGVAFSGANSNSAVDVSPVYRFFNRATGTHFYTISKTEKDYISSNFSNFSFEGEAYYAHTTNSAGTKALHRFFNTQTGTHFYTTSDTEKINIQNTLPQYNYEGIAYYVE